MREEPWNQHHSNVVGLTKLGKSKEIQSQLGSAQPLPPGMAGDALGWMLDAVCC